MTIDAIHQRTIRKTTLSGLRQRIDTRVEPPAWLTRKQFDKLEAATQEEYDDQRLHWFSNGLFVKTPTTRHLVRSASALLRMHDPNTVGERGIVLTGPPHIGKTTALIHMAAEVETRIAKWESTFRAWGHAPVAYIEMEPKASPKSIASSLLNFFDIPHNFKTATQHQLTTAALDALQRHRTRVLVIDELQMLKLNGKAGDDAINSLKTIMNDSGAICVFSGVDLTQELSSRAAGQIMDRCQIIEARPITPSDDESRGRWAAMIESLGDAMHLLDADPGHLLPYADLLLTLSQGKIGDLRQILGHALAIAIEDRNDGAPEVLSQETILGVGSIGVA